MFPHRFDRYRMMGYIMRQLRHSKDLTQRSLGELIESRRSRKGPSQTPHPTLQRRISHIENFDHLEERANHGHNPVARAVFISIASDGLNLSQSDTDALLWLIEAKDYQPLNRAELLSHPSFSTTEPREYQANESRMRCLHLLREAVKTDTDDRKTPVHMVTGWEEEHQVTFRAKLLEMESKPGQRLLVSKFPSFLTYPDNVFDHIEGFRRGLSPTAQANMIRLTNQRQKNFREKVRDYGERCIHSGESLIRYLDKKFRHPLPWPQRQRHIENVIDLLRECENFEVALASIEPEMEFVIKSGQAASLRGTARDIYRTQGSVLCGPLYIFWDETTTVYSFMVDFEHAWDNIPPAQRNKEAVVSELERLLRNSTT